MLKNNKNFKFKKPDCFDITSCAIARAVLCVFVVNAIGPLPLAQSQDFALPQPGIMVNLSPAYAPAILKGIKVHPDNPFYFDFILDQGDNSLPPAGRAREGALKEQSIRLIKYFLAGLTIPERDLWVNLSPYEKDRIIPPAFGQTTMGRDLLAEDYMLKQVTASLIYPEGETGKKFWANIYAQAAKRFGTTNVPVNTFNKVWIVPDRAVIYENTKAGTAYIKDSRLKVMLEQDYLAFNKHINNSLPLAGRSTGGGDTNALSSKVLGQIVIPELNREVNQGSNFCQLRQVYNSLILAYWYKNKIKNNILTQVYSAKNKTAGINIDDPREKQKIYERYLRAFKKGVFNFIKYTQAPEGISEPRQYFSGGTTFDQASMARALSFTAKETLLKGVALDHAMLITVRLKPFKVAIRRGDGPQVKKARPGKTIIDRGNTSDFAMVKEARDKAMKAWVSSFNDKLKWLNQTRKGVQQAMDIFFKDKMRFSKTNWGVWFGHLDPEVVKKDLIKKGIGTDIHEPDPLEWLNAVISESVLTALIVDNPLAMDGIFKERSETEHPGFRASGSRAIDRSLEYLALIKRRIVNWNILYSVYVAKSHLWFSGHDEAMKVSNEALISNPGGIDLTSTRPVVQSQNVIQPVKFHISSPGGSDFGRDAAQLVELQNSPGFLPVIVSFKTLKNLQQFLAGASVV